MLRVKKEFLITVIKSNADLVSETSYTFREYQYAVIQMLWTENI